MTARATKSFLRLFGPDLASQLPHSELTYQVTVENATTIVWNEIVVFYDLVGMEGVVPLIVQGVFPQAPRSRSTCARAVVFIAS